VDIPTLNIAAHGGNLPAGARYRHIAATSVELNNVAVDINFDITDELAVLNDAIDSYLPVDDADTAPGELTPVDDDTATSLHIEVHILSPAPYERPVFVLIAASR
jgi:hypothetical protein